MGTEPKRTILERFAQILPPWGVFLGIVLGMAGMSFAGHLAGEANIYKKRERFNLRISPSGYVYPTIDHLCAYVRQRAPKDKILVIVGGNSVMLGVGQHEEHLWTRELQRQLGDKFAVVNLAFRGANFDEMGGVVAQVLSQEYPKMYLVAYANPFQINFTTLVNPRNEYNYLFWQALCSGKLNELGPRNFDVARNSLNAKDEATRHIAQENLLQGLFETTTASSNLWNYIGYKNFFTVFVYLRENPRRFWQPLKEINDDEAMIPLDPERFTRNVELELKIVNSYLCSVKEMPDGTLEIDPGYMNGLKTFGAFARDKFPKVLILGIPPATPFQRQMDARWEEKKAFAMKENFEALAKEGVDTVFINNLEDDDYTDRCHLTDSATPKLAKIAGEKLTAMARRDGYLPASKP